MCADFYIDPGLCQPVGMLHLIAHNIRSAENVGSLLRTSDSLGVDVLWITGYSPTPEHSKVAKTALGAQTSVEWKHELDVEKVIADLKGKGFEIVGLELTPDAMPLHTYKPHKDVAILLGSEREGISPSLISMCDKVVFIEQQGIKESMNVAVAAGIAAYWCSLQG